MAFENILFTKAHLAVDDDSFYMMDDGLDILFKKSAGGNTIYSYPLDVPITSAVFSMEHDGINFWTSQDIAGGVSIKRWKIEDFVCKLKNTLNFTPGFVSDAFTVEHYHTNLSATVSGGGNVINTDLHYNSVIVSGTTLTLGPNSSDQYEDMNVISVSGINITLASGVSYTFEVGNYVRFYNNLWIFNSTGVGTLHKINARTGAAITTYSGTEYDNITACTFARVDHVTTSGVDALIYEKAQNLKYLNVNTLTFYGVMTIDNLTPPSTNIIVYDLAIVDDNIYRLQDRAYYFGSTYVWTTYNYVLSTVRRFIDTVSQSVYPVILPNNGVSVSKLTVLVGDQYGDGVVNKPVYFTDDDTIGFITINPAYTDAVFDTGLAASYYKAGLAVRTVTVVCTATQYD